jgi:hypothetical protein
MSSIDIVIVNWNSRQYLRNCVESLRRAHAVRPDLIRSVVIVDNASSDDSLEGLDRPGLPLQIVRNEGNRGFAAACNQGARLGTARHLLFLNPDTTVSAGTLDASARFMDAPDNQTVGICGVQLRDDAGTIARSCARFPSARMYIVSAFGLDRAFPRRFQPHFMAEWDHASTRTVDQVMGAYFFIRRPLFVSLGGFDERYFVYLEEVDLSWRARQSGYSTMFLAGVHAYHRGGGSSENVKAKRLYYVLRSRILYAFKNFRPLPALAVAAVILCLEPTTRVVRALLSRSLGGVAETLAGYAYLWAWVPRYVLFGKTR